MSNEKVQVSQNSIGVLGLLGVLFVGLKLAGLINWSWWWVTAPFWGGFALVFGILLIALLVAGIVAVFSR